MSLVSQAQVEGQIVSYPPVILTVESECVGALTPCPGIDSAPERLWQAKEEVGLTRAGAASRNRQGTRSGGELAGVVHKTGPTIIARVEGIDPGPFVLEAEAKDVRASGDDRRVFELNNGICKELLRTDIRTSDAARPRGTEVERQESRPAVIAVLN